MKMYEIVKLNRHQYFINVIEIEQPYHAHNTRFIANNSLILPLYTCTRSQRSFIYRGISNWNAIPFNIRNINSTYKFRRAIKNYLFTK